jgi:nitrous oxidase accessory protein NosD
MVKVIGISYEGSGKLGDFSWMVNQEEYKNSLFIFNDNIECHFQYNAGSGNAIMRKYNRYSNLEIPKSAGIPTGSLTKNGFTELSDEVKYIINSSIQEIKDLISKYNYDTIYYSKDKDKDLIGTSIFKVNENVLKYITKNIKELIK